MSFGRLQNRESIFKNQLYFSTSEANIWKSIFLNTIYNSIEKHETGINLTKYVQNLYIENYKPLMRKIKEILEKWREMQSV